MEASEKLALSRQARSMFERHDHGSHADRLTRENCGACCLAGYRPRGDGMTGDFNYCQGCDLVYLAQDCERHYEGRTVIFTCPVCASATTKVGPEGDDLGILDYLVAQ